MGIGSQRHAPAALFPGKGPGTHRTVYWVDPRAGQKGWGKSLSSGIRPLDRPARGKCLYLLRYSGPSIHPRTETSFGSVVLHFLIENGRMSGHSPE